MVSTNILSSGGLFGNERLLWPRQKPKADWLTSADEGPVSDSRVERQRSLWIASTATAVSWLGSHLLFPPLHLVSIPLTLTAALPLFQRAIRAVRNQQTDLSQAGSLGVIGGLLVQQTTGAALIPLLYFTGETVIEKWKESHPQVGEPTIDASLLADSEIQIVRCWQEKSGNAQPVMRYVLESLDGSTRQGFTQLSDLLDTLRGKVAAPQPAAPPTVAIDQ